MDWLAIAIAALVSALILLVEHYAPVRRFHPTVNYTLGTLGLILPYSALLIYRQAWIELAAIWILVAVGGLAVLVAYWIDHTLALKQLLKAAEREARLLRPEEPDATDERD